MELGLYAAIFLCAVCAVLAAVQPAPTTIRLPASMGTARRSAFWNLLAMLGTTMPQRGRQEEALRGRLIYTGSKLTAEEFGGIKLLATLAGCGVAVMVGRELGSLDPAMAVGGGIVGFLAPNVWLRARVAKRQRAILRLLPEVIDLMALCIGAGVDFQAALNRVVAIQQFQRQPLIEELSLTLHEIKLGKRRGEALKALAKRINLPELSSFVRTVVQAERMGTPIAQVLALHSEDLRLERFMRAERAALQAPIKILGPLIFCIMPCVAIIVGAPIFLQFMRQSPLGR